MAVELINVAWLVKCSPVAKVVLVSLADHANRNDDRCDPSVRRVADRTSLSEKSVSRGLEELEQAGHITVVRANGARNKYVIHPKPPTDSPRISSRTKDAQSVLSGQTEALTTDTTTDTNDPNHGLSVQKPPTDSPPNRFEPLNQIQPPPPPATETAVVVVDSPSIQEEQPFGPGNDFAITASLKAWGESSGCESLDRYVPAFRVKIQSATKLRDFESYFIRCIEEKWIVATPEAQSVAAWWRDEPVNADPVDRVPRDWARTASGIDQMSAALELTFELGVPHPSRTDACIQELKRRGNRTHVPLSPETAAARKADIAAFVAEQRLTR